MMPGNGFAALDPCNPNIISRRVPRTNPKTRLRNEPNLILCFQQKLKTKANFQLPAAALKPARAVRHDATKA